MRTRTHASAGTFANVANKKNVLDILDLYDRVDENLRRHDPRYPSVVHNEDEGIRLLLNHLMSLGHREIAHIAGPRHVSTGFVRYSAFEKYRKLLNADRDSRLVVFARAFTEAEGERCAEELLARERR